MPLTISTLTILTVAHHDTDSPDSAPIVGILKRAVPTPYTEHKVGGGHCGPVLTTQAAIAHKADMALRKDRLKRLETNLHTSANPPRALLAVYEAELQAYNSRIARFDSARPSNPVFLGPLARCAQDVTARTVYIAEPVLLLSLALSFDHLGSRAARDGLLLLFTTMGAERLRGTLDKLNCSTLVKPSVAQLSFMMPYL